MIQKYTCSNGVRIVHEKMPHVKSVAIGLWIHAGSSNETKEQEGIAHFIEHMLFKGTAARSARMIAEQFDQIGGDLNAFTSKEMTCYYTTVLSHHASYALTILSDMFFHSQFKEEEMEKEKSVILDEISSVEDMPDEDADERLWAGMFPDDTIGKPVGGRAESIKAFTKEMVEEFMVKHYRPENLVISIAGNYDDRLIKLIEANFGSYQSKETPSITISESAVPNFTAQKILKAKDIEQAHMCFGYPSLPSTHEKIYELSLFDSILGGTMSSRLFQEVRENRGLAYSVYTYYAAYKNAGGFVIYCGTSPENFKETYETIDQVIAELLHDGLTDKELRNAKEQLKGSFVLGLEGSESRMYRNGRNELILGFHQNIDEVVDRIENVEKRNVYRLGQQMLASDRAASIIAPKSNIQQFKILQN
ncbi:peptidase M16 [Sporosarcina sp. P37]|uniref:M16 family metallopeptidase n=1 Tax=unclassified Sporosarcina TaxID=2647733 RepID=UPI000A17ED65|nr:MULTISPECIES: pitrilysin family protein [unclassified Sporosarcina]ARK26347.1 peptidase M16 [Sporosarcina sp. P37]PID19321.1 insulinase family protein [Sporosarcina sp. P35]